MKTISLPEAMDSAATAVYQDRIKADQQFGKGLYDQAVIHHTKRNLRANVTLGGTKDRDGFCSQFVDYTWSHVYDEAPHHVYFDFFRPSLLNSVSRLSRGLEA